MNVVSTAVFKIFEWTDNLTYIHTYIQTYIQTTPDAGRIPIPIASIDY